MDEERTEGREGCEIERGREEMNGGSRGGGGRGGREMDGCIGTEGGEDVCGWILKRFDGRMNGEVEAGRKREAGRDGVMEGSETYGGNLGYPNNGEESGRAAELNGWVDGSRQSREPGVGEGGID